ncbi:MAG: hypothetical protein AB7O32_11615 [Vicinamibacterales bacterium]
MDSSPVLPGAPASLWSHVVWLLLVALPVATVSWTVTHEEIFREWREFCLERSRRARRLSQRKFFYVFTCEYCFSHYVTLMFLVVTRFRLLLDGWRGYLLAFFAVVAVANVYMSLFGRLRVDIRSERLDVAVKEAVKEDVDAGRLPPSAAHPVDR